jgi:antitoxin CptB
MDTLRKRVLFRSQRCGMRENDVLLGRFAAARIDRLSKPQLLAFEALLAENDNDIYDWISGRVPVPERHDNDLVAALRAFCRGERTLKH